MHIWFFGKSLVENAQKFHLLTKLSAMQIKEFFLLREVCKVKIFKLGH